MWSSLIKQGISLVSNPWHQMSKSVFSRWRSFLWSQVIQSVPVDVIVLVHLVGRKRVDEGESLARSTAEGTLC